MKYCTYIHSCVRTWRKVELDQNWKQKLEFEPPRDSGQVCIPFPGNICLQPSDNTFLLTANQSDPVRGKKGNALLARARGGRRLSILTARYFSGAKGRYPAGKVMGGFHIRNGDVKHAGRNLAGCKFSFQFMENHLVHKTLLQICRWLLRQMAFGSR